MSTDDYVKKIQTALRDSYRGLSVFWTSDAKLIMYTSGGELARQMMCERPDAWVGNYKPGARAETIRADFAARYEEHLKRGMAA